MSIFKSPTSILKKARPKALHPALNKATKAEQQGDYETAIVYLNQLLQLYPKSYSILCRKAFASWKLGSYTQALKDLAVAIKLKPTKTLAYNYRAEGIPGSNFSTSVRYKHFNKFNMESSTSAFTKTGDHKVIIDRAKEFMNNFRDPLNLIRFKYLVENLEIEPSAPLLELLVDALLLLSDASLFNVKCYTRNTIPHLELHLRTLVATLEIVFYSPIILNCETRDKLYSNLDNFIDIHYRVTEMSSQRVNHSFKSKFKFKEVNNIYMNFPNYNINFLLIHLRDTLHSMRDDETQLDEFFQRFKDGILALISAAPRISPAAVGNVPAALVDSFISNTLPRIINVFKVKYPATYWYPTYLLESLWQHAFNQGYEQQKHDNILTILNNQKAFRALWTRKEPTALPNSLWFGVLDLAQNLSYKTVQPVNLALCYYLALESLQKSQCSYINFKSLEVLVSLSYQEPHWFKDIVQEEIEKFIEPLPVDARLKFETLIHDVNQKLQLNNEFIKQVDVNYSKKSIIKNNVPDKTSNPLLEIIAENFTCKITGQITGDFLILSCCGNSISHDAIKIKIESVYNLIQNTMMKGLYKRLEKEGYLNNLIEEQQISTNKIYIAEDDLLLKMNKMNIFGIHMSSKSISFEKGSSKSLTSSIK
ncbi:95_t:CDS:2 [Dentiscutata erythropus]|uniref:95_t:CDS:1 n=1 Tax=Dentiscutata erythropus TaxID=1348616 RepID=A0A9N9CR87_9GLOM|nr:95_t:CDS:2 [Dentiscutata erythropus]